MKNSILNQYLNKVFKSPIIYLCIISIAAISSINTIQNIKFISSILEQVDMIFGFDAYRKIIPILAAIPFASNFCNEYNSGFIKFNLIRCNRKKYINTNIFMCLFTSFITTFLGIILFATIFSLNFDFYIESSNPKPAPFGIIIDNGYPILYTIIKIFIYSLSSSMWIMIGFAFSVIFPSPFVAIISPFIFSYIIEQITFNLPPYFNLYYLSLSSDVISKGPTMTFIYILFVFGVVIFISSLIFSNLVKKRVKNEFN